MRIGHASSGDAAGTPGDQTGREVCVQNWWGGQWDVVLRPKNRAVAERMARFCEDCCANPNVGYSQTTRNTLRDAARAAGWDGAKINTPCNCDCSSFMAVCAEAGGVNMNSAYSWGNAPWTGVQEARFVGTGAFEAIKPFPGAEYLRRGDVLVNSGHTIMVLDDGAMAEYGAPGSSRPTDALPKAGDKITYKAGSGVYFRSDAESSPYTEIDGDETQATVIKVMPEAKRPMLVLIDNSDVCGWITQESVKTAQEAQRQRVHTVVVGDCLWSIAWQYGVSMDAIRKANGMQTIYDVIHPGDRLIIPN